MKKILKQELINIVIFIVGLLLVFGTLAIDDWFFENHYDLWETTAFSLISMFFTIMPFYGMVRAWVHNNK